MVRVAVDRELLVARALLVLPSVPFSEPPEVERQNTPRRNVDGDVLVIYFAQRDGARSERWALQPDGSSPSGAVSPIQI